MFPNRMVQLFTSNSGYLIRSSSGHVAILLRVNGEKVPCPSEDIFSVNEVENSRVKQGHSLGEGFQQRQRQQAPEDKGTHLIGKAS